MTPPAAMPQTHPGRLIKDTRISDDPHEGQQARPWKAYWRGGIDLSVQPPRSTEAVCRYPAGPEPPSGKSQTRSVTCTDPTRTMATS